MTMTDAAAAKADAAVVKRAAYTAGLRQIAGWLDAHPEVKLPFEGTLHPLTWTFGGETAREHMAAAISAFPGHLAEHATGRDDEIYAVRGAVAGVAVQFQGRRDLICTVTGYENREVPVYGPGPLLAGPGSEPAA